MSDTGARLYTAALQDLPVAGAPRRQVPIEAAPIQVWGHVPTVGTVSFYREDDGYRVRFHGIADFRLGPAGELRAVVPQTNAVLPWQGSYLRQVRPLRWVLQGRSVFHAGAVCRDGHAVALLGPSGRGKSTLTAACAARGFAFLTDDCMVLEGTDPPMVQPDMAWIRLREDSAEALSAIDGDAVAVRQVGEKPSLHAHAAMPHCTRATALACALVLDSEPADAVAVQRLSAADAALAWCANGFVVDPKTPAAMRALMQRAAALSVAVPVHRLTFPRAYARLDDVAAAVTATLAGSIDP